jgi:O-antigen/teichoic acid export membrane protein
MAQSRLSRALPWAIFEAVANALIGALGLLILSRTLGPSDFGVIALGQSVVSLVGLASGAGLAAALVQRPRLQVEDIDAAHTGGLVLGLGGSVACAGLAAAWWLTTGQAVVALVIAVQGLTCFVGAFEMAPGAILSRKLRTKALARRTLLSKVVYTVIACGLALAGYGVAGVVLATVVQSLFAATILWVTQSRKPKIRFDGARFVSLLKFGLPVMLEASLWSLIGRSFFMLVGIVHGVTTLGYISLAFRVSDVVTSLLQGVSSKFALPLLAQAQHDPARLARAFRSGTEILCVVATPCFVGLALTASEWVPIAFGSEWRAAVPLTAVACLVQVLVFARLLGGPAVQAVGHPRALLLPGLVAGLVSIAGVFVTAGMSPIAVILAWASRVLVTAPLGYFLVQRYAGLGARVQLAPVVRPTIACAVMTAAVLLSDRLLAAASIGEAQLLALKIAVGACAFVGVGAILYRNEAAGILRILLARLGTRPSAG